MKTSDFDLQHQNQHTESKVVAALERIAQAFRVLLWNESKEFSLSPIQIQILIFLLHHNKEKRKVSYLAAEFNMTKATISDTIKTLLLKGLVTKEYLTEDSRSYTIQLTSQGRGAAKQTSLFTNEIRKPINRLSDTQKTDLLVGLFDVIHHLNQKGIIAIQRMCLTCSYYQSSGRGKPYCSLLSQTLSQKNLRLDCPEHHLKD
jgi:DNA-binding MarR family transcriptional regulator